MGCFAVPMKGSFLALPPPPRGPAEGAGRGRRAAPFALIGGITLSVFLIFNWSILGHAGEEVVVSLAVALVASWLLVPWASLPRRAQAVLPALALVLIVAMQVFALPLDRDITALMILPVLWSALYGSAAEALVVTGSAIGTSVVLQVVATITGQPVGFTGWTELVALSGAMLLIMYFTVSARSHARTDALTRVGNRRAWDEILAHEVERARRYPAPLTVALIDLDNFKRFNDVFGHPAGDRHLAASAAAWAGSLRATDVIARIGGEEFAVLLVDADDDTARHVLRRLAAATPNGQTCSIGMARWNGMEDPSTLMGRADDALYAAKGAGRNRIAASEEAINDAGPPMGGPVIGTEARAA